MSEEKQEHKKRILPEVDKTKIEKFSKLESTTPQQGGGALAIVCLGVAIYLIYLAVNTLF